MWYFICTFLKLSMDHLSMQPLFNILRTTSIGTVKQRMEFIWVLLCHFHSKVNATAEFSRLVAYKGKCEADLHCPSGPVQITTSCPQFYLEELCSKSFHNFSHASSQQPVPLCGRSTAICSAKLTLRPSACVHAFSGTGPLPAVPATGMSRFSFLAPAVREEGLSCF